MHWCAIEEATGKIIMNGSCGAEATAADFALSGGTPLLNIPAHVMHEKHYYLNGTFHEFGASPGEFYAWDWTTHTWAIPASALDAAKAKQSDILNAACRAAIYEGFDSDALGTVHHYPAKEQDQSNLVASVTASFYPSLPVDWVTPFWCSNADGVWNYALHSAAQIQHAGADGKAAILAQLIHNEGLQQQVKAAVSIAEVQAVVW